MRERPCASAAVPHRVRRGHFAVRAASSRTAAPESRLRRVVSRTCRDASRRGRRRLRRNGNGTVTGRSAKAFALRLLLPPGADQGRPLRYFWSAKASAERRALLLQQCFERRQRARPAVADDLVVAPPALALFEPGLHHAHF